MTQSKYFKVLALGGLGEIGMNCLVVEAEKRLLVLDCGVMFSSENGGADLAHPGFEYLVARQADIEAVVITHAHEDHLSGLPFLLQRMDVPVFGDTYALGLLAHRASESEFSLKPMTRPLSPNTAVTIGPFTVTSFPMPHSIIQNIGLRIDMLGGRLLHTGDFKLGVKGADRGQVALDTLRRVAQGGVDLMLSDSTGAEEMEPVGEESEVETALNALFGETSGRIFVATFSSNINRIKSVFRVAGAHGRKVALCGLSVQNHVRIALQAAQIEIPSDLIVPLDKAVDLPRRELAVIVSGTQGELRSALNRLATENHHLLRVDPGDLVVLSSRFIPGNELPISQMIDHLLMRGARVVHKHNRPDIHVSGHGSRSEIRQAVQAVRPRCFLPVHGTVHHLHACAELAREAGVKHVEVALNGQVVRCGEGALTIHETPIPTRRVYIDSGGTIPETAFRDRKLLGSNGVLIVSVLLNAKGHIAGSVDIMARGVVADDALPWLGTLVEQKVKAVLSQMDPEDAENPSLCRDAIRSGIRRFLTKQISREPLVLVFARSYT